MTQKVEENNLFLADPGKITFQTGPNPIRHVIYILKENRTYDQVLGDLKLDGRKVGNGDPSLTMYGADVTPNLHKLALQFGVLDNFYDSGEVSGDGHDWSNAAITSDYNEKTWQIAYRGKERTYDFQGTVADEFPLELGEPDVDAPGTGYLWDNLASHASDLPRLRRVHRGSVVRGSKEIGCFAEGRHALSIQLGVRARRGPQG